MTVNVDIDRLRRAVGHTHEYIDPRIDLPLEQQVELLMQWACSRRPEPIRRTVPPEPTDHDILITHVLAKLVRLIDTDRTVPRTLSPTAGHNRGTARRPEGAPPSTLGASRQRIQRDLEGRL